MSLSTSLNIAQQALTSNAQLSSILSRNIAGQNDTNYSVKTGKVVTDSSGVGTYSGVTRATNAALFTNLLSANCRRPRARPWPTASINWNRPSS